MHSQESSKSAESSNQSKGHHMPTLSVFYGIVVTMYTELGSTHHLPHIHAKYAEHEISITLDGTILEGNLPEKKLRQLLVWMDLHHDELIGNWTLIQSGEPHQKIKPLI